MIVAADLVVDHPEVLELGPKTFGVLLGGILAHVFEKALHVRHRWCGHGGDEGHCNVC